MSNTNPFSAVGGATVSISATSSSGSSQADLGTQGSNVEIVNTGAEPVHVRFASTTGQAAGATYQAIPATSRVVVTRNPANRYVTAYAATGTNVVYFNPGDGQ